MFHFLGEEAECLCYFGEWLGVAGGLSVDEGHEYELFLCVFVLGMGLCGAE